MPKTIMIPTPLRAYTAKKAAIVVEGRTVGEMLDELTRLHAPLKQHLFDDKGRLRSFVNVYVNDQDIRYLQKEKTEVTDNDVVSIIPSIAGGKDGAR